MFETYISLSSLPSYNKVLGHGKRGFWFWGPSPSRYLGISIKLSLFCLTALRDEDLNVYQCKFIFTAENPIARDPYKSAVPNYFSHNPIDRPEILCGPRQCSHLCPQFTGGRDLMGLQLLCSSCFCAHSHQRWEVISRAVQNRSI